MATPSETPSETPKTGSDCWLIEKHVQYNVQCQGCGLWEFIWSEDMGYGASFKGAEKEFRSIDWGTRKRAWYCPCCLKERRNA